MPEWLKGTGCKPVSSAYLGSNPSAPTSFARVAQSVEHFVGNEEVTGSSPVAGSILFKFLTYIDSSLGVALCRRVDAACQSTYAYHLFRFREERLIAW